MQFSAIVFVKKTISFHSSTFKSIKVANNQNRENKSGAQESACESGSEWVGSGSESGSESGLCESWVGKLIGQEGMS